MKCIQCQYENPENNKFCGNCGLKFGVDTSSYIEENIKAIQKEARSIENQTLGNIQEKAIKWSKIQLFFLSIAISILIIALYYFGYTQYSDLTKVFNNNKDLMDKEVKEAQAKIDGFKKECKKWKDELENINPGAMLNEMKKNSKEFEEKVKYVKNLQRKADTNLQSIQKLQNSMVEILIMFQGDDNQFVDTKDWLYSVLNEEGFIISEGNIGRFEVNRTEIIYYNSNSQPQAELIYSILIQKFPGIDKPLHIQRTRTKRRNIQIKLKMTDFRG
jgi:hypothetical protein